MGAQEIVINNIITRLSKLEGRTSTEILPKLKMLEDKLKELEGKPKEHEKEEKIEEHQKKEEQPIIRELYPKQEKPKKKPRKLDINTNAIKIQKALDVAVYGITDGSHHKMWVIDQMVRALTGNNYEQWVSDFESGEGGPKTYTWEEGDPP